MSLSPICGKILKRLLFNEMFKFFIENKLISSNQPCFRPGGSCINQLLSNAHEIFESFDVGLEVKSVFLDISKAFNKLWHDGIIYKLTQNEISGNLLNLLQTLLNKLKKSLLVAKQKKYIILRQCLKIPVFLSHHPRNTWVLFLTPSKYLMNIKKCYL